MRRRLVLLLAVVIAGPRAAEAQVELAGPPPHSLCSDGCAHLEKDPDDRPFVNRWVASGVGLAVGFSAGLALGNKAGSEGASTSLRGGWLVGDSIVAGTTAAAWLATRIFDRPSDRLGGGRWSDCDDGRDSLNRLDRSVAAALGGRRGRQDKAAISDMTLLAAASLPFGVVAGAQPDARGRDFAVMTGALAVNFALHDVAIRLFERPRPYAHFCRPLGHDDLCGKHARSSFYSGHASTAFAMAVTAGMLSHYHGNPNEGWVWATGLTLATSTGILRLAADKHYLTDVVTGAAVGGVVGFVIPRIHRPGAAPQQRAGAPMPPAVVSFPLRLPGRGGQGAVRAGFGSAPFLEASWHW